VEYKSGVKGNMNHSFEIEIPHDDGKGFDRRIAEIGEVKEHAGGLYRPGKVNGVDWTAYHNEFTKSFMYFWTGQATERMFRWTRLNPDEVGIRVGEQVLWPGQLLAGHLRREVCRLGVKGMLGEGSPLRAAIEPVPEERIAVIELLREGPWCGLPGTLGQVLDKDVEAIIYSDTSHAGEDNVFGRIGETKIFKDRDLYPDQRERITQIIIEDGVASLKNAEDMMRAKVIVSALL
jgi:hypothetical protein